jgi:CubicO group peptidase (beta-lactamase class C family)
MKIFYLFLLLIAVGGRAQGPDDPLTFQRMQAAIDSGLYPNIHSVLVARHNEVVYEHYWPGKDEILGEDLGVRLHGVDSLHDMRSITKSFVGACIGIAIAQGKIRDINVPVFSFFPEYARLDTGMKRTLTLRHLLTMSSGLDWDETRPYTDPRNSEIAMDRSPDPIGFVLSQPMAYPPGTMWKYNGGTTEVLAAIIRKVSGKTIDEYAKEYLFTPLGISHWQWLRNPKSGLPSAAAGLRLRARDLLTFGLLYCNEGRWKGRQIVPKQWVDSSLVTHIQRDGFGGPGGYGYQFWTFPFTLKDAEAVIPTGVGNGDQKLFIDRKHDLVVIVTAGNYNNFSIRKNANALMGDYVYPIMSLK